MQSLRDRKTYQTLLSRGMPVLAAAAVLVQLITIWTKLPDLQGDWQVLNSLPAVKSLINFDVFLLYVLALRWLGAVLAWAAAFSVFRRSALSSASPNWAASLTALLMALLPGLLLLDAGSPLNLPSPWAQLLMGLSVLLSAVTVLGLMLFGFLFPDLRFTPPWMGWLAVPLSVGLPLALSGIIGGDNLFPIIMLALLFTLLLGIGSQVYRYLRRADSHQRRQTGGVVTALALLPFSFFLGIIFDSPGWPILINLHLQILGAALLPIAILDAVLRRGLWAENILQQPTRLFPRWAVFLAAAVLGFAALVASFLLPGRPQALNLEPLTASPSPRPVVIDTDMAPDDWMAILFLLQRPDIEVKAITVTGTGEAHCEPGVRNALGLVALSGKKGIPAACGRETPLQGQNVFPADWRQTADTMAGLSLPQGEPPSPGFDAVTILAQVFEQSPQKVTLLALGPLTNLADGLLKDPGFLGNVEKIFVMGGALNVPGNIGFTGIPNQVAEWNIYIDPLAAQIVFESGAPVTLVPLDATNQVPANLKFFRLLGANRRTAEADFVYQVLQFKLDEVAGGYSYFWDPLAAGLLADETLGYFREAPVKIYPAPGPSSGMIRVMDDGVPMRYATSADRKRFELEFLRALNQP